MSRHGLTIAGAALLVAATVAACSTTVTGTAAPETTDAAIGTSEPPESRPATPSNPADGSGEATIAAPGECVQGDDPAPVDCERSHTVEITSAGTFGGAMADGAPERDEIFAAVFPTCREEAGKYLGSDDFDLTTLSAWLLWAGEEAWERGERWYRCGVAELNEENLAAERSGSIRNALRGDGVHDYRLCSLPAPSEKTPVPTACDRPHRGEAVSLVPMGENTDPLPTEDEFDAAAKDKCEAAVIEYLGASREDVSAAWRWPDEVAWRHGFNNFTCYLQTTEPVTGSLRGIKSSPLPR